MRFNRFTQFISDPWNDFDFVIVTVSLIPVGGAETVFVARLLRIVRILRVITIVPEFRRIIDGLIKTIPRAGYIILLMSIFFYIWAAIGSLLFDDIDPSRWGNIGVLVGIGVAVSSVFYCHSDVRLEVRLAPSSARNFIWRLLRRCF